MVVVVGGIVVLICWLCIVVFLSVGVRVALPLVVVVVVEVVPASLHGFLHVSALPVPMSSQVFFQFCLGVFVRLGFRRVSGEVLVGFLWFRG